jgi:AcrR family transcriptional regulator/DNA-binding MarR family transcriptional regulator
MSDGRRHRARAPLPSTVAVGRGGLQVSEVQRSRMLSSAVAIVSEYGYGRMSVARITGRARVSRRTFYDVFEDREDCFLAVFDDAVARIVEVMVGAYERERGNWREKVRSALISLLVFLDEEHEVGSLLIVDALRAGPRVLERRAGVLERVGVALQEGGSRSRTARKLPALTGESVVGAVFSVIHTRISQQRAGSMVELANPLMEMIVLPFQGAAAAARELERPLPSPTARGSRTPGRSDGTAAPAVTTISAVTPSSSSLSVGRGDPLAELPMRITYRTLRVLSVIGECPGVSNRDVADLAGVADQGQMSKLLARLQRLGLLSNGVGSAPGRGEPNQWRLTAQGEEVERAIRTRSERSHDLESDGIEGTRS